MTEMVTATEVQVYILQKVEADAEFRARLIADPKGVIEAETGVDLPDDALVFVQEAIANAQQAVSSADKPLTADELAQATGGWGGSGGDGSTLECWQGFEGACRTSPR